VGGGSDGSWWLVKSLPYIELLTLAVVVGGVRKKERKKTFSMSHFDVNLKR
jgi:hypothetical protein